MGAVTAIGSNVTSFLDGSAATIIAAGIGGGIALVGLIANKQNKTSEFRQAWIDALRQDIASLIGILYAIQGGSDDSSRDTETVNSLSARIHLRFKYEDRASAEFQRALGHAMKLETLRASNSDFKAATDRLVNESQKRLRREWQVVKKGERTYRVLIGALVVCFSAALIGGLLMVDKRAKPLPGVYPPALQQMPLPPANHSKQENQSAPLRDTLVPRLLRLRASAGWFGLNSLSRVGGFCGTYCCADSLEQGC